MVYRCNCETDGAWRWIDSSFVGVVERQGTNHEFAMPLRVEAIGAGEYMRQQFNNCLGHHQWHLSCWSHVLPAQHLQLNHFVGWSPAIFPTSGQNPTSLGLKFKSWSWFQSHLQVLTSYALLKPAIFIGICYFQGLEAESIKEFEANVAWSCLVPLKEWWTTHV